MQKSHMHTSISHHVNVNVMWCTKIRSRIFVRPQVFVNFFMHNMKRRRFTAPNEPQETFKKRNITKKSVVKKENKKKKEERKDSSWADGLSVARACTQIALELEATKSELKVTNQKMESSKRKRMNKEKTFQKDISNHWGPPLSALPPKYRLGPGLKEVTSERTILFDAEKDFDFIKKMNMWYVSTGRRVEWGTRIPIKFEHFMYWLYVTDIEEDIMVASITWAGTYPHADDYYIKYMKKAAKRKFDLGYPLTVTRSQHFNKIFVSLADGGGDDPLDYVLEYPKDEKLRLSTSFEEFLKILDLPNMTFKTKDFEYPVDDDNLGGECWIEVMNLFL